MATLEKLVKALEALKLSKDPPSTEEDEAALRRKKKVDQCRFVADTMCSPSVKNAQNFASHLSFSVETLLELCDDPDSNIRMVADESLNRIIRSMMDNNVVKVHMELHKEIKKNGSVRSLRAALSRFAQLAHMIRPQKGKAYIQNLIPSLVEIAKRREELVLETLASSLPHILAALGSFTTDNNIRDLLKTFLWNLSSELAVVRRTAATSIVSVCLNSRKPSVFLSYTLNSLIDIIIPLKDSENSDTVLGVLNCVRLLLPHLSQPCDSGLRGSFGVRRDTQDSPHSVDRFIQVYELCLHFTKHADHNVVTTALETLHQLLLSAPTQLLDVLLSPRGLTRSRIQAQPQDSLSRRTLSEMSVASPAEQLTADSPLLDTQEDTIQDSRLRQWVQNSTTSSQVDSEESDVEGVSVGEFVPMTPILVATTMERAPSLEAEALVGRDTPSPEATEPPVQAQVWEIGQVVEADCVPLLYCCRCLVTGFLLPDGAQGVRVRVSVRALALQCLTQLIYIHPPLFFCSIDVNNQATEGGFSHVSDVLYLASHSDHQLRGLSCVLVGSFIRSALLAAPSSFQHWVEAQASDKTVSLDHLLSLLLTGLQDESSACVRHSLVGLSSCLGHLLDSCDHQSAAAVLPVLLRLSANPYWLVKVKLLGLLEELSYLLVYYVTDSCEFQERALHSVMLKLLGDDDNRVRRAACDAIARAAQRMYHPVDENGLDTVNSSTVRLTDSLLTGLFHRTNGNSKSAVEGTLSRIVSSVTKLMLQTSSKYLMAGCCEALSTLSVQYPPATYTRAWHCFLAKPLAEAKTAPSATGLLGTVVAQLTASPLALDLDVHSWLLVLAGNLFTGLSGLGLKITNVDKMENKLLWSHFSDPKLASLSEVLLHHMIRLLCMFVRVLEDVPANKNPTPSPIKRRTTRPTSPAKANAATVEKEGNKEEKGKFGQFSHIPHYNRLYENLCSAYGSYKTQLECSNKLAGLLRSVLLSLGQLLEFSTLTESGRVAEEVLLYLRTAVSLEPTASVTAVQQLLRSLFGSNKVALWEESGSAALSPTPCDHPTPGYYNTVLRRPLSDLSLAAEDQDDLNLLQNRLQRDVASHRKASSIVKGLMKGSDRHALASYIRLFEPMVIQALKQYTVTNNVHLQVAVLSLLTQLVQLRVNYCLLDSDQIFIEFVLKQFDFLEVGQINHAEVLIPKMFEFLVHLSYEKNHSKPVISVAKVIQLCDGLMASGQDPQTHCIPALSPVVEHVFMATSSTSAWQIKTQRDVVLAMLLRLVEYPQVLSLLARILSADSSGEECKRWSHQTADVLMPLLAQGRVRLDSAEAISSLLSLLNSFMPRTLSPLDPVLRVLFTSQLYEVEFRSRSLGTMLAMLVYIVRRNEEDSMLARLEDLKLCVREQSDDPLNASSANLNDPPQTVFARLLLRTLHCLTLELHSAAFCCHSDLSVHHLQYLLAHFLVTCTYMFKSNSHQLVSSGFSSLITQTDTSTIPELSRLMLSLSSRCPLVVVLWAQLLSVLGFQVKQFWSSIIDNSVDSIFSKKNKKTCLNSEIAERGCLIVFCEYIAVCEQNKPRLIEESTGLLSKHFTQLLTLYDEEPVAEYLEACKNKPSTSSLLLPAVATNKPSLIEESTGLLSKHFTQLLTLYDEEPVAEYLEACKNNPSTSSLLLPAVATVCATDPQIRLVSRVLDYLVSVSLDDSGSVLTVLASLLRHPHLVLARRAAALACSRVEYLLILEREEVIKLLNQEDLVNLLKMLTTNGRLACKHSGLVSLLNKLASTHYNLSPLCDQGRSVNTANIHTIALDKAWFLTQVRLRCCQADSAQQCSQLLSQLEYTDIESVLRCQQFNNCILQHCFTLGTKLTVQEGEEQLPALYRAARAALLQHVHHLLSLLPRAHQVYSPVGRLVYPKESKYTGRLTELFCDPQFMETLFRLVPAVTSYLLSVSEMSSSLQTTIPSEAMDDLARFGVLCMEVVQWLVARDSGGCRGWPSLLHLALQCARSVLRLDALSARLSMCQLGSVTSALATLAHLATGDHLSLPRHPGGSVNESLTVGIEDDSNFSLPKSTEGVGSGDEEESAEQDAVVSKHTRYQVAALVCWLEKSPEPLANVPHFILQSIRDVIKSIGRCGLVLWYSCTPPDTWPPSPPSPPSQPPLPSPLLQDIDLLRQVIFRISLFGWTSRTQFEETWMSLLAVLSASPGPDSEQDEVQAIMQGNSVAVQAITSLLVQTLLLPNPGHPSTGCLLHSSRDRPFALPSEWGPKLEGVLDTLYWKLQECQRVTRTSVCICRLHHRCNMDRLHSSCRYGYGQVSVDFLKTAVMSAEERATSAVNLDYLEHQKRIAESGLDLQSCLQFLLDLYSQWTQPKVNVTLSLLLEIVRSTVTISDLFSERSHFAWLLDLCLELSHSHPPEDEILHQYLVVAVCKAAAVLPALETEVCERVLRLLESSLKSVFPPTRVAALHGLLYLLESFIHVKEEEPVGDVPSKTPDTRQRLLQMSKEHINKHFPPDPSSGQSEESQLVLSSLVLYIMEYSPQELPPEVQSQLLQLVLSTSTSRQVVLYQALMQGLSRLVLAGVSGVREAATRLAMDRLGQADPAVSLVALKLLLTCMYSGEYTKMRGEGGIVDPEQMVATIEKTSALFDRVKKGSPLEVECVCAVLPYLLADFFPASEVLTKVIGEFLSPHQPHHRPLSAVIFQVLSQACREDQLPLLQAWLVMSLHIFTQTLPVAMASWCLSCFFISASTNPWLRAIFPHVQSRMGKCTYEDRKLLCIAASDFYRQLTDIQQKETFVKTFKEAAATPRSPFADVIASL